jgi:hypothetical protein
MTIDSTKYFCKRGAVSARLNLVDASLRGEYCYANPYSYGGDPINFIDPTGLFALDLAFVSIGWDSNKGWNFGFSTPFYSYTWNQNGSKTFTAGIDASISLGFFVLGGDIGYSYNTYSGHSVSTGGHICLGAEGNCAGIEAGGSLYWDPYGNYLGATAYGGAFAELTLGDYNAKVNAGYEIGLMGMEGRGLYAGANVGAKGASLYASWAENGGWNYGGQAKVGSWNYQGSGVISLIIMGYSFSNGEILSAAKNYHKGSSPLAKASENGAFDESGYFVISGHGLLINGKGYIQNQNIKNKDGIGLLLSAEDIAQQIKDDPRYKSGTPVKLASCLNAVMAQEVSTLLPDTDIMGPTTNLVYGGLGLFKKGSQYLADGGSWNTYRNGKLVSSKKDGFWDRQWAWQ